MKKLILLFNLLFIVGIFCISANDLIAPIDSAAINNSGKFKEQDFQRESIFPEGSQILGLASHFSWGADVGASIDLGGNNLSTFDADVNLGYKNNFISFIGVGGGVHHAFGSGNQFFPVYLLFRTSFRKTPSRFFLNLKAGYSFYNLKEYAAKGGINLSVGLGVKLAESRHFRSHIILSYGYFRLSDNDKGIGPWDINHVDQAQLRFGISF